MTTLQAILDQQADIIENVLRAHKITARVWGGVVTPRFVRYELTTTADMRLNKVLALKDEVAMMLGVSDVRMYRKNGAVYVEAPRTWADAAIFCWWPAASPFVFRRRSSPRPRRGRLYGG
jgi:DNA segregation ATPase FtsK/SpoIIIE-like protein